MFTEKYVVPGGKSTRYYEILEKEAWVEYKNGQKIYDKDVITHAVKHMHVVDRINPRKVAMASLVSSEILAMDLKEPEGKWFYNFKNWRKS